MVQIPALLQPWSQHIPVFWVFESVWSHTEHLELWLPRLKWICVMILPSKQAIFRFFNNQKVPLMTKVPEYSFLWESDMPCIKFSGIGGRLLQGCEDGTAIPRGLDAQWCPNFCLFWEPLYTLKNHWLPSKSFLYWNIWNMHLRNLK